MAACCDICEAAPAPFGFRPPGLASKLPKRLRDFCLWTCAKSDCREQAERRARAAVHADAPESAPQPAPAPGPLFGIQWHGGARERGLPGCETVTGAERAEDGRLAEAPRRARE